MKSTYAGLAGRVALVTGAGRGLGRAVSLRLLEHGAYVAASDIDIDALQSLSNSVGRDAYLAVLRADLGDAAAAGELVEKTVRRFGSIDILVNNAAVLHRKPLGEVTVEDFDRIIAVNLRAPFFLSRAAIDQMRRRRWGRIVNVSSVAVRTGGSSDVFPYAASKGGLVALTKALAKIAAADNILISAVLPAAMDTPMVADGYGRAALEEITAQIPLRRLALPEETAEAVLWLVSDSSSYVTGASLDVNGGWVMT